MTATNLFFRGIPTEPDVTALINHFGIPVEGTPISYADVAAVLHVSVAACRFRTVTQAWRRSLCSTHQIILAARNGEFQVRDPGARVALGKSKTRMHVRGLSDVRNIIVNTDRARLTDRERADADKVQRIASLAHSAALAEARRRPTPSLRAVNGAAPAAGTAQAAGE